MRGDEGHAHENSGLDQVGQHLAGEIAIPATVDCHEIGGRRQGGQTVGPGNPVDPVAGGGDLGKGLPKIGLILQGRQSADLGRAVHAEMVADLVERINQRRGGQRIADAGTRHAIGFREGPKADHAGIVDRDRRGGACGGEFDIGFVEHKKTALRKVIHRFGNCVPVMPCAHRVVGIGQIDQLGIHFGGLGKQGLGVFVIALVGHLVQHAAKPCDVEIERRIGPVRSHHRIARFQQHPAQIAQHPVNPFAHHHIFRGDPVMRGQRVDQVKIGRVGIHPNAGIGIAHGLDCLGRRAKDVFIRADARGKRAAPGAFLHFGSDEGHG